MVYFKFLFNNKINEEKTSFKEKVIGFILSHVLPNANPDFDNRYKDVVTWYIEYDDKNCCPCREVGVDLNDNAIKTSLSYSICVPRGTQIEYDKEVLIALSFKSTPTSRHGQQFLSSYSIYQVTTSLYLLSKSGLAFGKTWDKIKPITFSLNEVFSSFILLLNKNLKYTIKS